MPDQHPRQPTVTGRIYDSIFELLEQHPEGIRWSELNARVEASDPSLHPKTINGCVRRLVEAAPGGLSPPGAALKPCGYEQPVFVPQSRHV